MLTLLEFDTFIVFGQCNVREFPVSLVRLHGTCRGKGYRAGRLIYLRPTCWECNPVKGVSHSESSAVLERFLFLRIRKSN